METELIQLLSDHSDTSLIALFMAWFAVSQRKSAKSHRSLQEEVQPNGGRSLRDAVDRIEKTTKATNVDVARLDERVKNLEKRKTFWGR